MILSHSSIYLSLKHITKSKIFLVSKVIDVLKVSHHGSEYSTSTKFLQLVITVIKGICDVIIQCAPDVIQAAMTLIMSLLRAIADNIFEIAALGVQIVVGLIEGLAAGLPDLINAGFDLIISFINGLADAIVNKMPILLEAVMNLVTAIAKTLANIVTKGVEIAKELGQKFKEKILEFKEKFKEAAKNLVQGLVDGIKGKIQDAVDSIKELGTKIKDKFCDIFGINSPSRVFGEYGMYMDEGLANGLTKYAGKVEKKKI
mgnify:CR=1 FL=1